jgi:hypothetical protein
VGSYQDRSGHHQGLLLIQSSGAWAGAVTAPLPTPAASDPNASLSSVACLPSGYCSATGYYTDAAGHPQGLLLSGTIGSSGPSGLGRPRLSLSVPGRSRAGHRIPVWAVRAILVPGLSPTGTISFVVFGPQPSPPSSCATGGRLVGTAAAGGYGIYHPSGGFKPTRPGTYWWYARYGGDSGNNPAATRCGPRMAKTVVARRR